MRVTYYYYSHRNIEYNVETLAGVFTYDNVICSQNMNRKLLTYLVKFDTVNLFISLYCS